MNKSIFITGTDTNCGKTLVCGLLAGYWHNLGYSVALQKWVQTGLADDLQVSLKLAGFRKKDFLPDLSLMRPYWFKLAASPHLAAARQNQRINIKKIKKSFFALEKKFDKVIVEGTGGVLVPLTAKTTMIDLARQLALPAIIVSQNKLGTINHTLLTIEALKKRKIKILGIIFNTPKNPPEQIIFRNNIEIIRKISKVKILGVLPRQKNKKILTQEFNRIGKRITIVAGERKTH